MIRRTQYGSFMTNCGWGAPSLDYDRINKEAKKAERESARKLAAEVRAKKLQARFKSVLTLAVGIGICRQLVKEYGAKKIDSLLKGDDDGTYEDLKELAEKY